MFKYTCAGNFLVVQWLEFSIFTVMAPVQSQIRELRSPKPHVMAKQSKNKQTNKNQTCALQTYVFQESTV